MNQINKADLEIIEIVKDYMPKDLVEGCYIKNKTNGIVFNGKENSFGGLAVYKEDRFEILGTLDITAVLKCMGEKIKNTSYELEILGDWFYIIDYKKGETYKNRLGFFPNKPLQLYTQKELQDLITLLKKIGKN